MSVILFFTGTPLLSRNSSGVPKISSGIPERFAKNLSTQTQIKIFGENNFVSMKLHLDEKTGVAIVTVQKVKKLL